MTKKLPIMPKNRKLIACKTGLFSEVINNIAMVIPPAPIGIKPVSI